LTFQEFYLARALEPDGLRHALERHWKDARYEEVLALLASLLIEAGRVAEVDEAIGWLLEWGSKTHRRDPRVLHQMRRSPLRVALHLLSGAGVSWDELPRTQSWLQGWLRVSTFGRWAVAADRSPRPRCLLLWHATTMSMRARPSRKTPPRRPRCSLP